MTNDAATRPFQLRQQRPRRRVRGSTRLRPGSRCAYRARGVYGFPPAGPGVVVEQIALGRRWVQAWKNAAPKLERIRRQERRQLDAYAAISLCGSADYRAAPRAPKPTSG